MILDVIIPLCRLIIFWSWRLALSKLAFQGTESELAAAAASLSYASTQGGYGLNMIVLSTWEPQALQAMHTSGVTWVIVMGGLPALLLWHPTPWWGYKLGCHEWASECSRHDLVAQSQWLDCFWLCRKLGNVFLVPQHGSDAGHGWASGHRILSGQERNMNYIRRLLFVVVVLEASIHHLQYIIPTLQCPSLHIPLRLVFSSSARFIASS